MEAKTTNLRKNIENLTKSLGCNKEEIAFTPETINDKTTVYIGKLFPGIFKKDLQNIYTSPKRKIEMGEIEIGYKNRKNLIDEIKKNFAVTGYTEGIFIDPKFTVTKKRKKIKLVKIKVSQLGFKEEPTTEELYKEAEKFGLSICLPEVGPYLRIKYKEVFKKEQPKNEYLRIAMEKISGSGGIPDIFSLHRYDGLYYLDGNWTNYGDKRNLNSDFIFCLKS